ncbi:MAG: tRNA (adenosine(37)-N6)-threonylcarbamoyltransferase complex ATPase subunit type 1 TsaE [Akkermansiaceae bacterium]
MEIEVQSPEEMMDLGEEMASTTLSGAVFGLVGEMGAGKTHWTKGFLRKNQPKTAVTSPTFSIVNEYTEGEIPVYHFDFYRLNSANELPSLGWDEYLEEPGIIICEWADRFPELMPTKTRWLEFKHWKNGSRLVTSSSKPQ